MNLKLDHLEHGQANLETRLDKGGHKLGGSLSEQMTKYTMYALFGTEEKCPPPGFYGIFVASEMC